MFTRPCFVADVESRFFFHICVVTKCRASGFFEANLIITELLASSMAVVGRPEFIFSFRQVKLK